MATASGGQALKVAVTVIAEGGRANDAVIKLLAKHWRVPKSSITLLAGHTDRNKIIHVSGDPETLMARFSGLLPEDQGS